MKLGFKFYLELLVWLYLSNDSYYRNFLLVDYDFLLVAEKWMSEFLFLICLCMCMYMEDVLLHCEISYLH